MSERRFVRVLGIHPWSRGYGWILLESHSEIFDWGTVDIRKNKNAAALQRFGTLLEKYQPEVLALECYEEGSRRGGRIRILCRALVQRAHDRAMSVEIFTRGEVRAALHPMVPVTRQETAAAIAERLAALAPSLPPPRKIWTGEHSNMALFNAAGCALAWYAHRSAPQSSNRR